MDRPFSLSQDIVVLPSFLSRPVAGEIMTNTFLLKSSEPVLVDCGLFVDRDEFRPALVSQIDLADLRWLWLTHPDPDRIGR
jgi:glyoxylase-like metal-dependent hydrolase (beta-lactamase superfamily II)